MKSPEIRSSFIDFFHQRGHRVVPSAPLVPHGDPTLLFTNAGMVQFKNYFTGVERPPEPRAVTVQKCLRVSGKHNDLDNVGPSPRHHTFFEMLGNFSFGDYFKEEAIRFGWELVTRVWGLSPAHLFASVFREDDEAFALWKTISTLPEARIRRCGEQDNFWAMGDTGPCGPCSEIFVDLEPERPEVGWEEGTESGRYLEIWNLVFMQFDRGADGALVPLPKPSVDTGAGLERVSAVLQGVASNYDTDLFQPILAATAALAGTAYGGPGEAGAAADVAMRVIADHLRAVAFLLADGVIAGNEGRGYVLRRLLRRAVRHGMRLGFDRPFLHRLLPVVGEVLGDAYPELGATRDASAATIEAEEAKFLATLAGGARQVQEEIEAARRDGKSTLAGPVVFRLYDTHGLPLEVIREIAEEERMGIDEAGFEAALGAQRERSREAGGGEAHEEARRAGQGARPRRVAHPVRRLPAAGPREREGPAARALHRRRRASRSGTGGRRGGRRPPRPHDFLCRIRRPGGRPRNDHLGRRPRRGRRHPEGRHRRDLPSRHRERRRAEARCGGALGDRPRRTPPDPAQPHRHPPPPRRPARGAGPRRAPGRLAGRPRPPAIRLHARPAADPGRAAAGRGTGERGGPQGDADGDHRRPPPRRRPGRRRHGPVR